MSSQAFTPLPVPLIVYLDLDAHHLEVLSCRGTSLLNLDFDALSALVCNFVKVILNVTTLNTGRLVRDLTFYVDPCESVRIEYLESAFGPIELLLKKLPDELYAFIDGIVNIAIMHELET